MLYLTERAYQDARNEILIYKMCEFYEKSVTLQPKKKAEKDYEDRI